MNLTPTKAANIIENYVNGNITDAKKQISKLSVKQRKQLYNFAFSMEMDSVTQFVFEQI